MNVFEFMSDSPVLSFFDCNSDCVHDCTSSTVRVSVDEYQKARVATGSC